jgi:hypothetical protein
VSTPPSQPPGRRPPADREQAGEAERLRTEAAAVIRDRLLATIDDLGQDAVLWLAAPPVWTLGAAQAARFPVQSIVEFVRRACGAGWCKARGPLRDDAPPDLLFWMPDEVRRDVADALRDRLGGDRLTEDYTGVAQRVDTTAVLRTLQLTPGLAAELPGDELPGALEAWAGVIMAAQPALLSETVRDLGGRSRPPGTQRSVEVGEVLITRTQEAVAARDLSRAQDLVAAGEAIAGVLAGTTEQALSRARRLLALGQRRRQDERALVRYLDRPELSDAVARLLSKDAPASEAPATTRAGEAGERPWALHLQGVGGVGKTMLIRYLASGRYAADRKTAPIAVARADFDRINPDYPVRRPVQLLLELADELALHAASSDRADQALTVFRARAARAHEAVSGLREAGGAPLRNREVALAVDRFGDVLAELGNVLLILDTCEELAKADLGNPATPAVRATLDIIERLHKRAPAARVLFAGRRPLPKQTYLAVQPVAGFTVDEARTYLAASVRRPLPAALAEEMIRQSAAVDGPVPAAGQLPERVSPFDLALYAAWADEDTELDVAQVSRGSDAYVEGRIIERLNDPLVVRALPVLAAAGRCRVATIAPLLDCDPDVLGRQLAEQEWVAADGDPVTHVAARPTLARRLRRYFEADQRRAEFAARTATLASALLDGARQASLAEIDVDELLAALRLAKPAAAAALWDSIADRAAEPPGRWGTVLNLTGRVLGEWDEEEWPTTQALRATVTAAHIAASRRDSPLFDASGPWETVRAWADRHPDPAAARRLLDRAVLGLQPYAPDDRSLWRVVGDMFSFPGVDIAVQAAGSAELLAAFADSLHRLLEADRRDAAERLYRMPFITGRTDWPDPRTEGWMEVVRARLLADADPSAARGALDHAERLAGGATGEGPSWPDWIPPDDLLARIRIERGLIAPPEDLTVLDAWESYAANRLDTIDGERLASLCLRIRLRHGIIDATAAEGWETADSYNPDRVPACTAHDLVPPLFVSVSQAWMSAGDPEHALALLDRRRRAALGTRQDDLTARHADAATAAIDRRLRLPDRQSILIRLAEGHDSGDPGPAGLDDTQLLAWRALTVVSPGSLAVPVPSLRVNPRRWHAWWQSGTPSLSYGSAESPSARPSSPTSSDVADIQADLEEMRRLELLPGHSGPHSPLSAQVSALGDWLEQLPSAPTPTARTAEPHRELRAAMRLAALAGETFEIPSQVPPRLIAEMAFEEAELTALRIPDAASLLFTTAARAYRLAGDPLGESLARLSALITGYPANGPDAAFPDIAEYPLDEALGLLAGQLPKVFVTLSEQLQLGSGPWRYWTPEGREQTGWARAVREAAGLFADVRPTAIAPRPSSGESGLSPLPLPVASLGDSGAASSSPPPHGSVPAARPARRSGGPGIIAAVLAAGLVAGLGALGVFTLMSGVTHKPHHPVTTPTHYASASSTASRSPTNGGTVTGTGAATSVTSGAASVATTEQSPPPATSQSASTAATTGSEESPGPWIVALITGLAVLAVLLGWYLPKIVRLARGRGVGSARLGTLLFDVRRASLPLLYLQVRPRPWRTARPGVRTLLWLFTPAGWFATGYPDAGWHGNFAAATTSDASSRQEPVQWDTPRPKASTAWWRTGRGPALGIIHDPGRVDDLQFMVEPWERVLVASLSPAAAGRIEWIRLVDVDIPLPFASLVPESTLVAPAAWARALSAYYKMPRGVFLTGLLHVIGRAVATSAGPAMDPGTEAAAESGAQQVLYSVTELKQSLPAMVVLQAEPAAGAIIGAGPPDDQAEKLRLGAALAVDGVPAVLLLPVLPAGITDELARIITTHIGRQQGADAGAQQLLTRVRAAVAPHVPPQVLDDIVLFLNAARYRS